MQIKHKEYLKSLNENQLKAVLTINGPLLIAAGPGSGKTRTISYRTAYMIKEKGTDPSEILMITFTKKAADEMKKRISTLIDSNYVPFIGTFHSICLNILKKYGFKISLDNKFKIYDPKDQLDIFKLIMKDAKKKSINDILKRISFCKNNLILPFEAPFEIQEQYREYQSVLREKNALDFDDILLKTVKLLKKYPEVLNLLLWKYISVDEYQDTNRVQYELIKLLSKRDNNICVIGDSDQAIYAFRGANVQNFLKFGSDFKDINVIKLEQNYRSTPEIIKGAENVIKKNEDRMQRDLWTTKDKGNKIIICNTTDEKAEADYIVRVIENYMGGTSHYEIEAKNVEEKEAPYNFSDFAVLYRTHLQGQVIEEAFLKSGIPYQIIGAIPFYDKSEIKDIISYIRVIYDPNDYASLKRIINKPSRGIGGITINKIDEYTKKEDIPFYQACQEVDVLPLNSEQKDKVAKFVKLIESLRYESTEKKLSDLIRRLYEKIEIFEFYKDKKRQGHLYELLNFSVQFDDLPPYKSLESFIDDMTFMSDKDIFDEDKNAVTLLTLHASKGLEFPLVFIAGTEEKIIPYRFSEEEKENESEERRLFYVGMTRAQDELHILYTKERNLFGEKIKAKPSRFLKDIPEDIIIEKMHERKRRKKKKSKVDKSQLRLW